MSAESADDVITIQPTGTKLMDKDIKEEAVPLKNEQTETRNTVDELKKEEEKKKKRSDCDDCCLYTDDDDVGFLMDFLMCRWMCYCFHGCCRGSGDGCCDCGSGDHVGDSGDCCGDGDCCDCGDCDCGGCDCDCGDCSCFN